MANVEFETNAVTQTFEDIMKKLIAKKEKGSLVSDLHDDYLNYFVVDINKGIVVNVSIRKHGEKRNDGVVLDYGYLTNNNSIRDGFCRSVVFDIFEALSKLEFTDIKKTVVSMDTIDNGYIITIGLNHMNIDRMA